MKITILGAGSFGTAMAKQLADCGHEILLWTNDREQCGAINKTHRNSFCFQETELPETIACTLDIAEALGFSDKVICAVPTQAVRSVLEQTVSVKTGFHMLSLAKGIEIASGKLLHEIHAEITPDNVYSVLSGPSHAEELLAGCPTTVALASEKKSEAAMWQELLSGGRFRIYTSDDVTGLEVGGALKNIYAIAAGIISALRLGDNASAALACRGLAEMMRFGQKLGAKPITLAGLAGVGDLMVTCCSLHSRNFRLGLKIGGGLDFETAVKEIGQVAEGAYTVRAVVENSRKYNVEMPLAEGIYSILYKGILPEALLESYFARPLKKELDF